MAANFYLSGIPYCESRRRVPISGRRITEKALRCLQSHFCDIMHFLFGGQRMTRVDESRTELLPSSSYREHMSVSQEDIKSALINFGASQPVEATRAQQEAPT